MQYKFVGDGAGVPGLPHEISDEEAEALGVKQLLKDAIANGSYAPLSLNTTTSPRLQKTKTGGDEIKE